MSCWPSQSEGCEKKSVHVVVLSEGDGPKFEQFSDSVKFLLMSKFIHSKEENPQTLSTCVSRKIFFLIIYDWF